MEGGFTEGQDPPQLIVKEETNRIMEISGTFI